MVKDYILIKKVMMVQNINDLLMTAFEFHGHKCPALLLGLRAGIAAMKVLKVERSLDQELYLISETGDDHAGGCFVDGLMVATGCTFGKGNIEKTNCDKFAFTLIDTVSQRAVRAILLKENVETLMHSRFVEERMKGRSPMEIPANIMSPLMASVLSKSENNFIDFGTVTNWKWKQKPKMYDTSICDNCGELTFISKLIDKDNKKICPCCFQKLYSK